MPEVPKEELAENFYDASSSPTSFELKFIECTHIITVPLRVYPDPHAPKPRPAAPARYDSRDFFSRPVRVPGICPTCHKAKPAAKSTPKPVARAASAGAAETCASDSAASAVASTAPVATAGGEPEPTPPP
jgi:hypothetical protein